MLVPKLAVCMIHLFHSNAVKFNFLKKLFGCDCFDLAVCMIHLFHSNAVKFNFLKKLFGCDCFDLDPETECKLFCRQVRNEVKI